jgi:hypothetical protein
LQRAFWALGTSRMHFALFLPFSCIDGGPQFIGLAAGRPSRTAARIRPIRPGLVCNAGELPRWCGRAILIRSRYSGVRLGNRPHVAGLQFFTGPLKHR